MTREEAERITDKVLRSLRDEMPKAAPAELAAAFFERMRSNVEFTEAVLKALIEDLVRDLVLAPRYPALSRLKLRDLCARSLRQLPQQQQQQPPLPSIQPELLRRGCLCPCSSAAST